MSWLEVDGWAVAQVDLEHTWGRRDIPDRCWVFRSPAGWTLVTMRRTERYEDTDQPVGGRATIGTAQFATVAELAEHVTDAYDSGAWVDLLDAGAGHDEQLYEAWVPERVRRDFDAASIYNKDLARATGFFDAQPVPAVGRALPGWESEAVAQMAAHLVDVGFEVLTDTPGVRLEDDSPLLGALRVRRYGWETVGVVRVDDVGEIFVRVPDPTEVDGPLWRRAPESDW